MALTWKKAECLIGVCEDGFVRGVVAPNEYDDTFTGLWEGYGEDYFMSDDAGEVESIVELSHTEAKSKKRRARKGGK